MASDLAECIVSAAQRLPSSTPYCLLLGIYGRNRYAADPQAPGKAFVLEVHPDASRRAMVVRFMDMVYGLALDEPICKEGTRGHVLCRDMLHMVDVKGSAEVFWRVKANGSHDYHHVVAVVRGRYVGDGSGDAKLVLGDVVYEQVLAKNFFSWTEAAMRYLQHLQLMLHRAHAPVDPGFTS